MRWVWMLVCAGCLAGCQDRASEPPPSVVPPPQASATSLGAVSLPEMSSCLGDCRAADPEGDCERVCKERCSAACDQDGKPSSFADRCRQDCASEIERLRSE